MKFIKTKNNGETHSTYNLTHFLFVLFRITMTTLCPIERATGDLFLLKGHAHLDDHKVVLGGYACLQKQ